MKADIEKLLSPRKRKWKAKEAGQLLLIFFAQFDAKWNNKENGDPYAFQIKREVTSEDMARATILIETELEAYYKRGEARGSYTAEELDEYRLYKDVRDFLTTAIRVKDTEERIVTTAIEGMSTVGVLSATALIQEKEAIKLVVPKTKDLYQSTIEAEIKQDYVQYLKSVAINRERNLIEATEEAFRYLVTFDATMKILAEVSEIEELGLIKSGSHILKEKLEEVVKLTIDIVSFKTFPLPMLEIEMLSTMPRAEDLRKFLQVKKKADIYDLWSVTRILYARIGRFSTIYDWRGGGDDRSRE